MKFLVISTRSKLAITQPLWLFARDYFDFEHAIVADDNDIRGYFLQNDLSVYDRIIIDGNLRRVGKKTGYKFLRQVSNLVFFDHDMCQTTISSSPWYKKYPSVLRDIGNIRVIVSGVDLRDHFRAEGIDAEYLPKAYDSSVISNMKGQRNVAAAFVGRTNNKAYRLRKKFLQQISSRLGVSILRSEPGAPYNALLNSIRIFVSADIGYGEYMIKNYEAMAAGCAVLAWRQSVSENQALGFQDMKNIALYDSTEEFEQKLKILLENPSQLESIAAAGQQLVEDAHAWKNRAHELVALLLPEVKPAKKVTWRDKWVTAFMR